MREQPSTLLGEPYLLRGLATRHDGVTLLLLDVAPAAACPAEILDKLSVEEQARAARFRSVEDRSRFGVTRAALRHVLGAVTGQAPESLVFTAGPRGKPRLADADEPHFNVSHSGSLALIGISGRRPIGVDIEAAREINDMLDVAQACFSPREYRALVQLDPKQLDSTFYAIWTGKEAVMKALGTGIGESLRDFSVVPTDCRYSVIAETPDLVPRLADVLLERIAVPATYTAAFALA
jgi:4'-phosphopantetheinyl transferase